MGAGKAVKDAGLEDKVLVYATGGGDDVTCKAVEDKVLHRVWSYDADGQGRDAATVIDLLLQGAAAADGSMLSIESPMKIIKAGDPNASSLCWKL
jgi:ABC-type sugar transport system substrate-binding protein